MCSSLIFKQLEPGNNVISTLLGFGGLSWRDVAEPRNGLIQLCSIVIVHGLMNNTAPFVTGQVEFCGKLIMLAMFLMFATVGTLTDIGVAHVFSGARRSAW